MSLASWLLADLYKLPKRLCGVRRTGNIRVPADDGVMLETEHYAPRLAGRHPTLLMRVPYGLQGFSTVAECYAERGFNVVLQACRAPAARAASSILAHERVDGLATIAWLKAQDWYDGRLGTTGPSYLGYAQWAISDALPPQSAMATKVTSAEFRSVVFPGGAFHLGLWLNWLQTVEGIREDVLRFGRRFWTGSIERRTLRVSMKLPLADADRRAVGHTVPFWQRWVRDAVGNDGFWEALDHTHRLGLRTPPNHFISGWYDFMVDQLLRDYETLVLAGQQPYLTVGPWVHVASELQAESMRETLSWMRAHLMGDASALREAPVRLYVTGLDAWCDFDAYPPGQPDIQIWHLHPAKVLSLRPVGATPPDTYRYDPKNPTRTSAAPSSPSSAPARWTTPARGPRRRPHHTSEPLFTATTLIGNARMTLYARSSLPTADFFVRLCDVDEKGVSTNICDGFVRVGYGAPAMPDDIWRLTIKLHATAHAFKRNHRLRVIVASGAHPRYARNTGTDEPLAEATTLVASDIEIFHDPDHPSALHIPAFEI